MKALLRKALRAGHFLKSNRIFILFYSLLKLFFPIDLTVNHPWRSGRKFGGMPSYCMARTEGIRLV
ncbi:MAG: hypothetical protein EOM46_01620 [Gammaproteobacteria bacterium]|nr:hypothetical protein [Gammaproteobacteria bacterium]